MEIFSVFFFSFTLKIAKNVFHFLFNTSFCDLFMHRQSWNVVAERVYDILKDYPRLRLTHGRKVCIIQRQNLASSTLSLALLFDSWHFIDYFLLVYVSVTLSLGFRSPTCDKLGQGESCHILAGITW